MDFFNGLIDDVRIYNRALSASDVAELYAWTSGPPPTDTTPPVRSNGAPTGMLPAGTISTTISLTTNENATCRYSTTAGTAYGSMPNTFTTTGGTSHSTTVSGLSNGQTYTYFARCQDSADNVNATDFTIGFSVANSASFDFSLSNTGNVTVTQGQAVTNTITAALLSGSSQSVSFSTSGLPTGTSASYVSTSCNPTCSTTMTISTLSSTPAGMYPVVVNGSSGGVDRTTSFTLTVQATGGAPGDQTMPGTMTLTPTFESIGIRVSFSGDTNINTAANIDFRKLGTSIWKQAHIPYIDQFSQVRVASGLITNPYHRQARGSIVGLDRDTEYEVRVTFNDPDGVAGSNPVLGTIRTWGHDLAPSNGNTYYVATNGSNANQGTESAPWLTLQHAANSVSAGDKVLVQPGSYAPFTLSRAGVPNSYITFKSADAGNEATITDEITLAGDYVRIRDFQFLNGIGVNGSRFAIIENNDISDSGIRLLGSDFTGTLIQNNVIHDTSQSASGETGDQYNTGIYKKGTGVGGVVVRYNTIRNVWDGIGGSGNGTILGDGYSDSDFYGNVIERVNDDGLEVEGDSINSRIWANTISDSDRNAIGTNLVVVGPIYVFRNVGYNLTNNGFKIGRGVGKGYYYHNTLYDIGNAGISDSDPPPQENLELRNNIFHANTYGLQIGGLSYKMNFNNYDTTGNLRIRWGYRTTSDTTYQNLAAFKSAFPDLEINGLQVESQFVNGQLGDFNLQSSSPLVNAGVLITGFNDSNSPWPFNGSAPDIGAHEYVQSGGTLVGDLNTDGTVNSLDWGIMNAAWFTSDPASDLNGDGLVNSTDLSV